MSLSEIIESKIQPNSEQLQELGIKIGQLYTDMGFPIDMALNKLDMTKEQKISILDGACQWLIEHKRNSGATDKSIERQRKTNREMLERFIKGKEIGAY